MIRSPYESWKHPVSSCPGRISLAWARISTMKIALSSSLLLGAMRTPTSWSHYQ
jgi:hypothetical protein